MHIYFSTYDRECEQTVNIFFSLPGKKKYLKHLNFKVGIGDYYSSWYNISHFSYFKVLILHYLPKTIFLIEQTHVYSVANPRVSNNVTAPHHTNNLCNSLARIHWKCLWIMIFCKGPEFTPYAKIKIQRKLLRPHNFRAMCTDTANGNFP